MDKKVISKLEELYNKIDEFGHGHPIQTRPKPTPGITGEKPGEVTSRHVGGIVFNRDFSSKKVNQSSNREIDDEDDEDDLDGGIYV